MGTVPAIARTLTEIPTAEDRSRCTICRHAERVRAEIALASGERRTVVARRYGMSPWALKRHFSLHVGEDRLAGLLSAKQRQEFMAAVIDESSSAIEHAKGIRAALEQRFYVVFKAATDDMTLTALARELRQVNNSIARMTGELASSPLVSVTNTQMSVAVLMESPEMARFWAEVVGALHDLPNFRDIHARLSAFVKRHEDAAGASIPPALPTAVETADAAA